MPAPASVTIENATKDDLLQALLDNIDADASAAYVEILSEADVVLSTITFNQPAGTIASSVLTLSPAGPDSSAAQTGTATWAAVYDGAGVIIMSIPAIESATPVDNKIALNTVSIIAGGPVEIVSFTVG